MFDIGWSELLVIGVVALIAIGPKELPGVLRAVGHWMGKIRRMASEFQGQFQEAMREAELADVKKQFDDMTSVTGDLTKFDPLADMQKDIERSVTAEPPLVARAAEAAATSTPLPDAPAPVPERDISVPLPEPPSPVSNADFAPPAKEADAKPEPKAELKKAESGA
jgi:sec-independent protein translocase protein TatB